MRTEELELLHMTTALRTQMMNVLTDEDLAFQFPNNPSLGKLYRYMGDVERSYIESFRTFAQRWDNVNTDPALATNVEHLKA